MWFAFRTHGEIAAEAVAFFEPYRDIAAKAVRRIEVNFLDLLYLRNLTIMNSTTTIVVLRVDYYERAHIGLQFAKNEALLAEMRVLLPEIRWSGSLHMWHIPWRDDIISLLFMHFKGRFYIDYAQFRKDTLSARPLVAQKVANPASELPKLDESREKLLKQFKLHMHSCRYSESTIKTYSEALGVFFGISTTDF
jgi:hypothetical protein